MRNFMLWALVLALFSISVLGEDNSTCVAEEESEEYPPGKGGQYPPPQKGGSPKEGQPPKGGEQPKKDWKHGCKSKSSDPTTSSTSSSTTTSSSTSVTPSSLSTSTLSSSSSSSSSSTSVVPVPSPVAPVVTFGNSLFFTNTDTTFSPLSLPISALSRVFFAFAEVGTDGTVVSSNPTVDTQFNFGTKKSFGAKKQKPKRGATAGTAYGAVGALFNFKTQKRNLKVVLSLGGPTANENFTLAASTNVTRATFASTAVNLMANYGMDGIDIDWLFPLSDEDITNWLLLVAATRNALDEYSLLYTPGYKYTLSVPLAAQPIFYNNFNASTLAPLLKIVDNWNYQGFGYSGFFSLNTTHQANVYRVTNLTAYDTDTALNHYIEAGVPAANITVAMPLYGVPFYNTDGLGQPFGFAKDTKERRRSGENGGTPVPVNILYNDLPPSGPTVFYDDNAKASYSYNSTERIFVSYDDVQSVTFKTQYAIARGLAGNVFYEARGDNALGNNSLVGTSSSVFVNLSNDTNNLYYPTSEYDNIRAGLA